MYPNQIIPEETYGTTCQYIGGYFKSTEKGVVFIGSDKDGNELPSVGFAHTYQ